MMGFVFYNPNPDGKYVGDCVIRAISRLLRQDWNTTYYDICELGGDIHNMPSADDVWGEYLYRNGFRKHAILDTCPFCYTVKDFCLDHPVGSFLLKTSGHVVAVVNGNYYDTSDSGNEVPIYFWGK